MASKIKIKRSAVAGKVPLTTDLELSELAVNTNDGRLYTKKDNGTESIVEIGGPDFGSRNVTTTGTSTAASFIPTSSTVPANGVYLPAANSVAISTNGTGRFFINSAGRADVVSTSSVATNITSNQAITYLQLTNSTDAAGILSTGASLGFFAGSSGTERMRLTPTGLGIGSSAPSYLLDLLGSAPRIRVKDSSTGAAFHHFENNSGNFYLGIDNSTGGSLSAGNYARVLWSQGAYPLVFATNDTQRAQIDSSGRLLVGTTTSNGAQLEVNRPQSTTTGLSAVLNSPQFSITNSSNWGFPVGAVFKTPLANGGAIVDNAAIWAEFESTNNAYLGFATRSSGTVAERMRIRNDGSTSLYSTTSVIELRSAAAAGGGLEILNGYHSATSTSTGTRSVLIATNGNIQNTNNSYGAISDIKLKENIVDANSQWNDLKALQVRNYNFKEETGQQTHTQLGLIAQEVELVSPGLVSESPDRDLQGNDLGTTTKSVNYSVLYMKAVKALQEAMERIETLEAKVAALESA